ncbi:MAG: histidine kinase [Actinobacteria bacterium]|nr:histidine kinase [Actinomycetota bacterium]
MCTLVGLTILSSQISRAASKEVKLFTSAELASTSLFVAQRESLAYTTRFSQWIAGDIDRRDVQIARALLAQRLSIVTSSNLSVGEQLSQRYYENLAISDELLANSQPGLLSNADAEKIARQTKEFIDGMLFETRSLVAAYQSALDLLLEKSAVDRRERAEQALLVLFLFLALSLTLFATFVFTLRGLYRKNSVANAAQLRLINESISQLSEARSTVNQLELLDERKNVFISTVNHELRTPLTSIVGYIDILREKLKGISDEELSKIVDVLERNSNNLLNLVQDILSLTNLESGSSGLLKNQIDLKEIANDAILLLAPLSDTSQVKVVLEVEKELATHILANRNQFLEVVTNLLGNAIKFSKSGGTVKIKIEKSMKQSPVKMLRFSVADEGIGIPEAELEEIFSSFFRASNARNSGIPGTGLGLAIVSRIVEEHHGKITVNSIVDRGTVFSVEVPVFDVEIDQFIDGRKEDVLTKAIVALGSCTISELRDTCHEMVGVLGFYDLDGAGREISDFAAWFKGNDDAQESEIISRKLDVVESLRGNLAELKKLKEI